MNTTHIFNLTVDQQLFHYSLILFLPLNFKRNNRDIDIYKNSIKSHALLKNNFKAITFSSVYANALIILYSKSPLSPGLSKHHSVSQHYPSLSQRHGRGQGCYVSKGSWKRANDIFTPGVTFPLWHPNIPKLITGELSSVSSRHYLLWHSCRLIKAFQTHYGNCLEKMWLNLFHISWL